LAKGGQGGFAFTPSCKKKPSVSRRAFLVSPKAAVLADELSVVTAADIQDD
jgi:hypothetical protein